MQTRRQFIQQGFAVGAAFSLPTLSGLFAAETAPEAPLPAAPDGREPHLVAVRGGSRSAMLERALGRLGGIGAFVKPGQSVLVKPNIGWDKPPEVAANTHPELVGRIVALCVAAGAREVVVFDNTCSPWRKAYDTSGIAETARAAGAKVLNGKDKSLYRETKIPGATRLAAALVHQSWLDCDVIINVPVLKHHGGPRMTACMKNIMGAVWDRQFFHANDLARCIAESVLIRKPHLNILDAYHPMLRNGPQGKSAADTLEMKTLLLSRDIVTIDAAAAKMLGHAEDGISYVKLGAAMGLGRLDLANLAIERITLS
jgi:uncharacterized protein (DUF362 family)